MSKMCRRWGAILAVMVCCGCLLPGAALALELELPLDPADAASDFLGVAGFGYHVSEHRLDGHPGLDFEFKLGAKVRAAHAGRINFFTDSYDATKLTVQIDFAADGKNWRNVYTNIAAMEPGLGKDSTVIVGQVIGTAGTVSFKSGANTISYAMTHFQLDDMSGAVSYGLSNPTALSPVPYFSAAAQTALAALVDKVTYHQQLCEPFMTSPRGLLPYPSLARTWTLGAGSLAARIDFSCDHTAAQSVYGYTLVDAANQVLETGSVSTDTALSSLPKIEFTPTSGSASGSGSKRLGVYAVNANTGTLRLDYSAPGGARPTSLGGTSTYSTYGTESGATACASASDSLCLVGESSPYRSGQQINLNLAVRADRLSGAPASVDLWVALAAPDGSLWFFTPAGLGRNPGPWRSALALTPGQANTVTPLLVAVPVTAALAGRFAVFGVVVPVGTSGERVLADKLSNLLTVMVAIQP